MTTALGAVPVSVSRWRYAAAAVVMQVLLGILYSWSVFRGPLGVLHGWSKAQTVAPYRYSLLAFAAAMILAGFWQDRKGPRVVATAGGLLLGAGCLLAAIFHSSVEGLIVSYGVVAGMGVGFAYVTPIATCIKWFPDKRGTIAGLAVMGFGAGPLFFGPLVERLLGKDPSAYAETVPRTFLVLAVILAAGVMGAAQVYRVPPPGWKPAGWNPPQGRSAGLDLAPGGMVRTWQFWALWALYFLGTSVGLTAIGEATPLVQEMARAAAVISAGTALGVMSVFNGAGRLAWGNASDRFGRRNAMIAMCAVSALACAGFLRTPDGFWTVLAGLCLAAFAYGGYLALMPSFTADYFGAKHVGANYGILFSAWGVCGFVVPGYFAPIMDRARAAGDLAAGYRDVYTSLAVLALAAALLAALLRPPRRAFPTAEGSPASRRPAPAPAGGNG